MQDIRRLHFRSIAHPNGMERIRRQPFSAAVSDEGVNFLLNPCLAGISRTIDPVDLTVAGCG